MFNGPLTVAGCLAIMAVNQVPVFFATGLFDIPYRAACPLHRGYVFGAMDNLVASLFLVAMPFVPSSFLLLVVRSGAPSSVLAPNSDA